MISTYSQAGQDIFALEVNNYKKNGSFVEIGAYHSIDISNTYLLENQFNWRGISLELDAERVNEFNSNRKSKCLHADATCVDYNLILQLNNLPDIIDYLQVDIEPAFQSLKALELIVATKYKFRCITFEHDLYVSKNNLLIKNKQKDLLYSLGYKLYKENVSCAASKNAPFEDWWIL